MGIALRTLICRFGGFSLIGVANTLLSLGMLFVMTELAGIDCRVSYVTAYVVTIALAYVANAILVYRVRLSFSAGFRFSLSYLFGLVLGVVMLHVLHRVFGGVSPFLLSCCVVCLTTAVNFILINGVLSSCTNK